VHGVKSLSLPWEKIRLYPWISCRGLLAAEIVFFAVILFHEYADGLRRSSWMIKILAVYNIFIVNPFSSV
jgi:hypothetical protein